MKKTLSVALAAVIAASAVMVSVGEASAKPKHWNGNRWNGGGAAAAIFGTVIGLGVLSQAYRPYNYGYNYGYYPSYPNYNYYPRYSYYPPARPYVGGGFGSAHVQWCLNRYRTYNPATNTYFRKVGVPAVCYSPYG